MDAPTPEQVRSRSPFITKEIPAPTDSEPDPLIPYIEEACPLVASLTCRSIAGSPGEEVPAHKLPLALRAIVGKIEQAVSSYSSHRSRRRSMNAGRIKAFAAGNYSESYFGPEDAQKAKQLDSDPRLAEVLWALATDDCRAYWLSLWFPDDYPPPPASVIASFDYGLRPGGY